MFQNEAPVFEHDFEHVWTNMFSKHVGTRRCIPKHVQKQGPHFENTLWDFTYTYYNRVFLGMKTTILLHPK